LEDAILLMRLYGRVPAKAVPKDPTKDSPTKCSECWLATNRKSSDGLQADRPAASKLTGNRTNNQPMMSALMFIIFDFRPPINQPAD
jgi:hypothetical protein